MTSFFKLMINILLGNCYSIQGITSLFGMLSLEKNPLQGAISNSCAIFLPNINAADEGTLK